MTVIAWLSPVWNGTQFEDNNGVVLNGGKVFTYAAGSFSVEQTSYADDTGLTPNPNPIELDSSGRLPNALWLDSTQAYNLVLTMPDGVTVLKNVDNVTGVPIPVATSVSETIWSQVTPAPQYVSGTQFLLDGVFTAQFAVGNRVQIQNSDSSFQYGTVTAVSYSSPNTYVTVQNDSTVLVPTMATAWFSENVVTPGITVDAGAVSWTTGLTYSNLATVGGRIQALATSLSTSVATFNAEIEGLQVVWASSGGPTAYTITPSPAATSLSLNQIYAVDFNATSSGSPTLNVSGLGANPLVQYTTSGVSIPALIVAGQTTTVLYNGTDWVVQNPIPTSPGELCYWARYNNAAQGGGGFVNYQSHTIAEQGCTWGTPYASSITVTNAGIYDITASATVFNQVGVAGAPGIRIYHNGAYAGGYDSGGLYNNAGGYTTLTCGAILSLAANDNVEVYFDAAGGSGQPIGYSSAAGTGFFKGVRIA
jgi:hypothetical protein